MSFDSDPSKQAKKIVFRKNTLKIFHPQLRFNNSIVSQTPYQKQLGALVTQLAFEEHLNEIITNVNKTMGSLEILENILPRLVLMIYTTFCETTSGLWQRNL